MRLPIRRGIELSVTVPEFQRFQRTFERARFLKLRFSGRHVSGDV